MRLDAQLFVRASDKVTVVLPGPTGHRRTSALAQSRHPALGTEERVLKGASSQHQGPCGPGARDRSVDSSLARLQWSVLCVLGHQNPHYAVSARENHAYSTLRSLRTPFMSAFVPASRSSRHSRLRIGSCCALPVPVNAAGMLGW